MKTRLVKSLLAAALVMCQWVVRAEDIDLFVGSPADSNDLPNVLIIVDNTANWTPYFDAEMNALRDVFLSLPYNLVDGSARFNIGIMFSAETGSGNNNQQGGYVRAAMRPMTQANKAIYAAMIDALDVGTDKGNGGSSSLVMAEAYRYFSGGAPYAGNNKAKTDYTGNTGADWSPSVTSPASLAAMRDVYALPGNALVSKGATAYNWPVGSQCGKNYIIYISNGPSQDNNQYVTQSNSLLAAAGGTTTQIPLSPTGSQTNVSDEWARFLKQDSGLDVTTYAIEVNPSGNGQGPGWTAMMKKMAEVSGGIQNYTSVVNPADLAAAVNRNLSEIQDVNSVFASVSLPVSAQMQGTYSNQVYIGLFRPDGGAFPRWAGNLKQYQLGYVNDALRLVDADGASAINSSTGFITGCARSFWTPNSADSYWAFRPAGTCILPGTDEIIGQGSNYPDGNVVEKGAQGYMLRALNPSSTTRTFRTCTAGSCTSLTDFNIGNGAISAADLGATGTAERNALINWARGIDVNDEDGDNNVAEMRPSAHGDVVHSRPVAIEFGSANNPKVVVFYGGNDGVLRAINGNQSDSITSTVGNDTVTVGAGGEMWAFLPPEFYGSIKRIRDNTTQVSFPNITAPDARPKPYGIDGTITAYKGATDTWVYATMRRGGRALYAFNVQNSDPANITLKWRKGCPTNFPTTGAVSDTGCDTGFDGIGQTWSAAKAISVPGYNSPVLIVGGGYDTCEDRDPHTCSSSTKGNKIYVLNADTGALLNTLDTDRGVIADVTIVPDSATGLGKLAYAADLGGNVYRINLASGAPSTWGITKLASLGCATTAACTSNRKFMFAPDVLESNGEYVLLLGSGDREKPLLYYSAAAGVSNYFFMLKDRPNDATWLATELTNCSSAVLCLASLTPILTSANPSAADLASKKGWYLGLQSTEQVVTSAITIFGTVSFSTHVPDVPQVGQCTSRLGTARVYSVSYLNAASANGTTDRSQELPADTGLPPSPVAGTVKLNGEDVGFCIGCGSESSIQVEEAALPSSMLPTQPKSRVYWYIER